VSADAPPFLVVQGTHDTLVFVEEAREFVRALREKRPRVRPLSRDEGRAARVRGVPLAAQPVRGARGGERFLEAEHAKY
jgi:fermentation-respiration switch protein FrsA (DUF1100 family)